jgi:hypothetical protein
MKKRIVLFTGFLVLLFFLGLLVYYKIILPYIDDSDPDEWETVDYLMNDADVKVYFWGDQLKIPKNFKVENIKVFDFDSLDMDHDFVYMFVNDWNSSISVTKENAEALVDFADKHNNFHFVYIGNKAFDYFRQVIPTLQVRETDLAFSYVVDDGTRMCAYGGFEQSDCENPNVNEYMPMDSLILIMYSRVKRNNNL